MAKTPEAEVPAKGLELNQLVSLEDVTARVESAVRPDMTAAAASAARSAIIATIEKESFEKNRSS